jgi:hypothetical protein
MHLFEFLVSEFNRFFKRVTNAVKSLMQIGRTIDTVLFSVTGETNPAIPYLVVFTHRSVLAVLGASDKAKVVLLAVQFVAVYVVKLLTVLGIHDEAMKENMPSLAIREASHIPDITQTGQIPLVAGDAPEILIVNERVQIRSTLNFYRFHPILLPEVQ